MSRRKNDITPFAEALERALVQAEAELWADEDVIGEMPIDDVQDALTQLGLNTTALEEGISTILKEYEATDIPVDTDTDVRQEPLVHTMPTATAVGLSEEPVIGEPARGEASPAPHAKNGWALPVVGAVFAAVIAVFVAPSKYTKEPMQKGTSIIAKVPAKRVPLRKLRAGQTVSTINGTNVLKPKIRVKRSKVAQTKIDLPNARTQSSANHRPNADAYATTGQRAPNQGKRGPTALGLGPGTTSIDQGGLADPGLLQGQLPSRFSRLRLRRGDGRFGGRNGRSDGKKGYFFWSDRKNGEGLLSTSLRVDELKARIFRSKAQLALMGESTIRRALQDKIARAERLYKQVTKLAKQAWKQSQKNSIVSKVSVGGGKYLKLHKMRVTVQIDGLRARTVLDHIYYNPYGRTLQGTFKYTLPAEASVSYYAMFVGTRQVRRPRFFAGKLQLSRGHWRGFPTQPGEMVKRVPKRDWGKLREARLVAAQKGRKVYEDITRRKIDPALLEQMAPNTFQGRVFPIQAKGYNRVIIAYEHTLPRLGEHHLYRMRFAPDVAKSIDMTVLYNHKTATLTRHSLHKTRCKKPGHGGTLRCFWEKNKPKRDAVLYFKPRRAELSVTAGIDPTDNRKYLMGRAQIKLPQTAGAYSATQGVFLLDTSLSSSPSLFAAHVAMLKQLLQRNEATLRKFNVLFFDVAPRWARKDGWIANTPKARKALFQRIDRLLLEGATDLNAALRALSTIPGQNGLPLDVFLLTDGQQNWGLARLQKTLDQFHQKMQKARRRVRMFAYQMGIGNEALQTLRMLTAKDGAVFPCLGRSTLPRCAVAHTRPSMALDRVFVDGIEASEIFVGGKGGRLYDGALLPFSARYQKDGKASLRLKGTFRGKVHTIQIPFVVKAESDLAPRAWAEMAIHELSALHRPALTPLIVAYSQHFRIPNEHCSFLVLETDKEYKLYGLEKQRQAKKVEDVALFVAKEKKRAGKRDTHWIALLKQAVARVHLPQGQAQRLIKTLLRKPTSIASWREGRVREWRKTQVPKAYLTERMKRLGYFAPFVTEAKRRLSSSETGALRALSCIVEQFPKQSKALRLVGYYLMAWKKSRVALPLFVQVLARRSFEPHAFRDVAWALSQRGHLGLAAVMYEVILAGKWHNRFGDIKTIAKEEYALLLQAATRSRLPLQTRMMLQSRMAQLGIHAKRSRLRVTVTWNTDNTDIDLWVKEPGGKSCSYRRRETPAGGRMLQDVTRGYGPERYVNIGDKKGAFEIKLHYYGHSSNTFGNETHATVTIVTDAGTPAQRVIVKSVVLRGKKQWVTVARLNL